MGCQPMGALGWALRDWRLLWAERRRLHGEHVAWEFMQLPVRLQRPDSLQAAFHSRNKSCLQIDGDTFLNSGIKEGRFCWPRPGPTLISHWLI